MVTTWGSGVPQSGAANDDVAFSAGIGIGIGEAQMGGAGSMAGVAMFGAAAEPLPSTVRAGRSTAGPPSTAGGVVGPAGSVTTPPSMAGGGTGGDWSSLRAALTPRSL